MSFSGCRLERGAWENFREIGGRWVSELLTRWVCVAGAFGAGDGPLCGLWWAEGERERVAFGEKSTRWWVPALLVVSGGTRWWSALVLSGGDSGRPGEGKGQHLWERKNGPGSLNFK